MRRCDDAMVRWCAGAFALAVALSSAVLAAQEPQPADSSRVEFTEFLSRLKAEALSRGIGAETAERALSGFDPLPIVVERDRTQTETVLTIDQYLRRRLTPAFVRTAREMLATHRQLLDRVSAKYGTPASLIVAIWGMESNFGRFLGVRPTVQALATLAWDGRRGAFFTSELMDALRIVDHGDISLEALKGSWAGAMGQTQFMPSSYLAHAEDFDGDGRRDIWGSLPDVFASIAGYLKAYGWVEGERWGREVEVPSGTAVRLAERIGLRQSGCQAEREMTAAVPLAEWQALGVRSSGGRALPRSGRPASLLRAGRTAYLVYGNYDAILGYNCAHAYALAVGRLADQLGR